MRKFQVSAIAALGLLNLNLNAASLFNENFEFGIDGQFTAVSVASDKDWFHDSFNGDTSASMNGYNGDTNSDDWLISPEIDLTQTAIDTAILTFTTRGRYDGQNLKLKVSTDYQPDASPEVATWTEVTFNIPTETSGGSGSDFVPSGDVDLAAYIGQKIHFAYHYKTTFDAGEVNGAWHVDAVNVELTGDDLALPLSGSLNSSLGDSFRSIDNVEFTATAAQGAGTPYQFSWDFGDGSTAMGASVNHQFDSGDYTVTLTIADKDATNSIVLTKDISVAQTNEYSVDAKISASDIRVATFNVSMEAENYESDDSTVVSQGAQILADELAAGDNAQIKNIAEIIQRVRPDMVLLNEFDYIADANSGIEMFISQYLNVAQAEDVNSIDYPYYFVAPSNTGTPTNFDLDNNGTATGTQNDAYGFGQFEGHYAMVFISRFPIEQEDVRTFQKFLWKDMPGNLMPTDPATGENWYNEAETNEFRLSSKSHWDIPVNVDGELIHILASHPTPPTFDGAEDRNGTRNHDEVRFWADYVNPENSAYIYDDNGAFSGLTENARFVIVGDLNASVEGDAYDGTINQLLNNEYVYADFAPSSEGGLENDESNPLSPYHTASWQMRADYVLSSEFGLMAKQGSVFWPAENDNLYSLISSRTASSDHRLVWLDVAITDVKSDEEDKEDDFVIGSGTWTFYGIALLGLLSALRKRNR
ncbi:endonuclease/exonuclease/phosphatase family protein [Catenovulum adriaticum]|uniref:Endonuclease/exonuclease/phosphatase family protein n=1 Tax=Catenovulum adriaticum TaxID=2984846 RepID=A0ABY7AJV8_9ALTE|nr:endonuclease/exonuclease/phosphatase family protein [Catenovulum sp. TS8]WAJ69518.1 endonuclease/exonuclease/phosphatase family protein [Catenovulum sp. TS8]